MMHRSVGEQRHFSESLPGLALIFVGYFLMNRLALIFPDAENVLAVVWPAAGVGLGALLLSPARAWFRIVLAIFLAGNMANLLAGRPLFNSLGFMTANVLESLLCAAFIRWRCGPKVRFRRIQDVVALVFAAVLVNAATALVGAGTAAMAGMAPFFSFWKTWFVADGLGIFLVTPLVVAWSRPKFSSIVRRPSRVIEAVCLVCTFALLVWGTFEYQGQPSMFTPGLYMLIALLTWPALRFDTPVLTLATNVLAVVAVFNAEKSLGPLAGAADGRSLLLVQLYIWCAALTAHVQQALSLQRDRMAHKIRDSREFLNALLTQGQDVIITTDRTGLVRMVNARACEVLGYSRDELESMHIRDVDPRYPAYREEREIWAHLPMTFESEHLSRGGEKLPVEVSLSRILTSREELILGVVRDISERRQMQQALQENEANFRSFFETLQDLVWVIDLQGNICFANDVAYHVLGYERPELDGKPVLTVHPADMHDAAREIFADMMADRRGSCPLPLLRKDGSLVSVDTRASKGTWNGAPCVFGISKDLTEEEEARQRFERLFHGNPALMALTRLSDRVFVDVNEAMVTTLGYSREEILGRTVAELRLFPDAERQDAASQELANTGTVRGIELQVRCKDGSLRDGIFSGECLQSQQEQYLLTVMIDITERKRVEARLKIGEDRLGMALKAANSGLWDWNVVSGEVVIDHIWAELVGYSRSELLPATIETWAGLCHPEDLRESNRLVQEHFRGQSDFYECEVRMRHKAGHWVWISDRGKCVERTEDGSPVRMVGTHTDISARKRVDELREDMERILRHDLRTPAGNAVNAARLLSMSPGLSPDDRELAKMLERSGQDMLNTLNVYLELYRIESGTLEYSPETFALHDVLREACQSLRMETLRKRRQCELRILCPKDITVSGMSFLLRMALSNLVQNALEASPSGGLVRVDVADESPRKIAITNQGVVPEDIRQNFFEKYVTRGKSGGTGLGTYSARLMILAQGGGITMETSEERGETTITILMPDHPAGD